MSLERVAPGRTYDCSPVFDIDGPIRGFCVRRRFGPDEYVTMVRIFPAQGHDKSDKTVAGYYVEVSGEGTLFDGPSKDNKVFKEIIRELNEFSKPLAVRDVERGEYQLERDRWKLKDSELSTGIQSSKTSTDEIKNRLIQLVPFPKNNVNYFNIPP